MSSPAIIHGLASKKSTFGVTRRSCELMGDIVELFESNKLSLATELDGGINDARQAANSKFCTKINAAAGYSKAVDSGHAPFDRTTQAFY